MDIITELILCLIPAGTATTVIIAAAQIIIKKVKKMIQNSENNMKDIKTNSEKILSENANLREAITKLIKENADLKRTLRHVKVEEDKKDYEKKRAN